MATQQEVLASLEGDLKVNGKALLTAIAADGHAVDLEIDVLSAELGAYGPLFASLVKPFVKQVLQSVAEKI